MKTQNTIPRYIDLHTHTKYSDGMFLEPKESVRLAFINGINVLAITDHDNSIAYFEARDEADKLGVILLPGAEITTPDYHLLALNFNPYDKEFRLFLERSRKIQEEKCRMRVQRLREHGLPLTMDNVYSMFDPAKVRLGKYNIFISMLFNPECRQAVEKETPEFSFYERFKYYMGKEGVIGNLPDMGVSEEEAITAVHSAGGLIGIAHPPKDVENMDEMDRLVRLGIDFIEVQPRFKDKYDYGTFERYAKENRLPISYGSDYHGPTFYRQMLDRGENVLHADLERLLNLGYVKIPQGKLEGVCI